MFSIAEIEHLHPLLILLLPELRIKHAVTFLSQPRAAERVLAGSAIEEKCRVPALLTKLRGAKLKAAITIYDLVAPLGVHGFEKVRAGLIVENPIPIHAVLIFIGFDREVAVLAVPALIEIITVLHVHDVESQFRYLKQKFCKLREEGTIEIIGTPEVLPVPFVAVPGIVEVCFVW
jgi:hypothetical protein